MTEANTPTKTNASKNFMIYGLIIVVGLIVVWLVVDRLSTGTESPQVSAPETPAADAQPDQDAAATGDEKPSPAMAEQKVAEDMPATDASGPPGMVLGPDWACTQFTYAPSVTGSAAGVSMVGMGGPPGVAGAAGWICSQWTYNPKAAGNTSGATGN